MAESLPDNASICLGGLFKQNRPVALVRELIRLGRDNLTAYSSPGAGYDLDLLIAAGRIGTVMVPAVTLESRLCPNYRMAVEVGRVSSPPVDAVSVIGGLMAAAHGLPFQPVAALAGSDVIAANPLLVGMISPLDGTPLHVVPAIRPDLALLHAQEADEYGNVRHLSTMTYADALIARAAKRVIVSVDRIVPAESFVAEPGRTTIPCICVDAVVEIPFGAHPTASFPLYAMDEAHIEEYADLSDGVRRGDRGADALEAYLERFVHRPRDIFDYIDALGGYRHVAALEREARFL